MPQVDLGRVGCGLDVGKVTPRAQHGRGGMWGHGAGSGPAQLPPHTPDRRGKETDHPTKKRGLTGEI